MLLTWLSRSWTGIADVCLIVIRTEPRRLLLDLRYVVLWWAARWRVGRTALWEDSFLFVGLIGGVAKEVEACSGRFGLHGALLGLSRQTCNSLPFQLPNLPHSLLGLILRQLAQPYEHEP